VHTLLRNGRIVLPDSVLEPGAILISHGKISQIIDSSSPDSVVADSVIDLDHATIFPGFIDVHIHGAVSVDVNNADAAGLLRVAEFLASRGVTAWLPTLVPGPNEQYERALAAIGEAMEVQAADTTKGARVCGVHYEGPFVSTNNAGRCIANTFAHSKMPRTLIHCQRSIVKARFT
jgi:N-acetylglucosamine-6-phosphate deacetylase